MTQLREAPAKSKWGAVLALPFYLGMLLPRALREEIFLPSYFDLQQGVLLDFEDIDSKSSGSRRARIVGATLKAAVCVLFYGWVSKLLAECCLAAFRRRE